MLLVEIEDVNPLIDNKPFFWPTHQKQTRTIWKIVEMSKAMTIQKKIY